MNTAALPLLPARRLHHVDDRFGGFFDLTPAVASRYPRGIWLARNTRWLSTQSPCAKTMLGFLSLLIALSLLHRRIAARPKIPRAEVADLSICSMTIEICGLTLCINNSLKRNGISRRFRTELAVLYNETCTSDISNRDCVVPTLKTRR